MVEKVDENLQFTQYSIIILRSSMLLTAELQLTIIICLYYLPVMKKFKNCKKVGTEKK